MYPKIRQASMLDVSKQLACALQLLAVSVPLVDAVQSRKLNKATSVFRSSSASSKANSDQVSTPTIGVQKR